MFESFNENESFKENLINDNINELFTFKESIESILYGEENTNNYFVNKNFRNENGFPASSNKVKIVFKVFEENSTNCRTPLLPDFYSLDDIMSILDKICHNKTIKKKLKRGRSIEKSIGYDYMCTLNKKRKREVKNIILFDEEKKEINNRAKRGRKARNFSEIEHNKMTPDNIIKKIKAKLFEYIVKFFNSLLNKISLDNELAKIDYKFVDNLKRENEFQLLRSPLKDVLSLDVSPKYKFYDIAYNKKVIKAIIENEKNNFNYDTLMFVLNMTFREWFDVFTGKENFENIAKDYTGNKTKINFGQIKESFVGINTLLSDLIIESKVDKVDDDYFAFYVFYLYNYERWFFLKSPRNRRKSKEGENI